MILNIITGSVKRVIGLFKLVRYALADEEPPTPKIPTVTLEEHLKLYLPYDPGSGNHDLDIQHYISPENKSQNVRYFDVIKSFTETSPNSSFEIEIGPVGNTPGEVKSPEEIEGYIIVIRGEDLSKSSGLGFKRSEAEIKLHTKDRALVSSLHSDIVNGLRGGCTLEDIIKYAKRTSPYKDVVISTDCCLDLNKAVEEQDREEEERLSTKEGAQELLEQLKLQAKEAGRELSPEEEREFWQEWEEERNRG